MVKDSAVHVTKDDRLVCVFLDEAHYLDLIEDREESFRVRLAESVEDMKAGRVKRSTAQELCEEFGLDPYPSRWSGHRLLRRILLRQHSGWIRRWGRRALDLVA